MKKSTRSLATVRGCLEDTPRRRGALLLEVMLSLSLFVAASAAVLSIVGQSVGSLRATRERQHAVDLARSAMAELEAGIKSAELLNGPVPRWQAEDDGQPAFGDSGWELYVETEPSTFDGLTLVSISASPIGSDPHGARSFTLRQLVRLFDRGEAGVGEKDDISIEAEKSAKNAERSGPTIPSGSRPTKGGKR